ncbi:hypothetical protein [Pseudomonas sp. NPDC089734]|uniref:hypothetical protein n=1 Tax=Pseudomonas sp. NPDC089734 TaxID=3364469 RepID=UPI0037FC4F23
MLIRIEEGTYGADWIVKLNDYPVTCRNWQEAKAFAERMKSRIDAPHHLPSVTRRVAAERTRAQTL